MFSNFPEELVAWARWEVSSESLGVTPIPLCKEAGAVTGSLWRSTLKGKAKDFCHGNTTAQARGLQVDMCFDMLPAQQAVGKAVSSLCPGYFLAARQAASW